MYLMIHTTGKYILVNGQPRLERDLLKWAKWFAKSDEERIVGKTLINDSEVSTVFLGLDHSYSNALPILYESMVFGGTLNGKAIRYSTLVEAWKGHLKLVKRVEKAENKARAATSCVTVKVRNMVGSRRIIVTE